MRISISLKAVLFFSIFSIMAVGPSLCDTVIKIDGSEARGLILEDYTDRIVLSTVDGETVLMKRDIERLIYDEEAQNYLYLARSYQDKNRIKLALEYVDKALEADPGSEEAITMKNYMSSKLLISREDDLFEKVERRKKIMDLRSGRLPAAAEIDKKGAEREKLRRETGLDISSREGWIVISSVIPPSPAHDAGLEAGDRIVSISGMLIRYWPVERAVRELAGMRYTEINLVIERDIEIKPEGGNEKNASKDLGMKLSMEPDGLTVKSLSEGGLAALSGLKKGDLIISVDGNSTRYLPLPEADKLIYGGEGKVILTARRQKSIWRR